MLRKAAVRLSLNTYTSLEFYLGMNILDFLDIAVEIGEATKPDGQ